MGPADRAPQPARRTPAAPRRGAVAGSTTSPRSSRAAGPRTPAAVRAEAAPIAPPAGAIHRHGPDTVIILAILALTALGLLVVYSSSAIDGYLGGKGTFATLGPQLQWAAVGLLVMLAATRLDYRWLRLASVPLLLGAAALLLLVQVPSLQVEIGGSAQWLRLPGLPVVQPSELVKLALVVYLAHWMARRGSAVAGFRTGLLPFVVIVVPFVLVIFRAPDIGTAGVIGIAAVVMFFLAGANPLYLAGLGAAAVGAAAVFLRGYQLARLQSFADPFADAMGGGYQPAQGLLTLGQGGLVGTGLGGQATGAIVLPNAHNDYIFAVIGQEFGFLGAVAVIGLFCLLAYRGFRVALAAPDTFGGLLAAGITVWLCVQAFVNIGVVVTLLPVTGITLPFVSAGGSSLIVSLGAAGILLSVSRETAVHGGWVNASGDRGRRYGRAHLPGPRRRPLPSRAPGAA
jgi:cell division protein FtsW